MTNAWPAIALDWVTGGQLVNQRATPFVSLLTTCGTVVSANLTRMITKGMTCRGSSNGVTAALDGVNRNTNAAGWAVRNSATAAAQCWMVLTGSDGTQWLFSYTGAVDDVIRIAKSSVAGYVIAGTATFCPTATDEQVITSGNSLIGTTLSGDRVYNCFVDSTAKAWWWATFQAGVVAGFVVRGAPYDTGTPSFLVSPGAVLGPQTLGWFITPGAFTAGGMTGGAASTTTLGSSLRLTVGAGSVSVFAGSFALLAHGGLTVDRNIALELNGNVAPAKYMGIYANTASCHGYVGWQVDAWSTYDPQPCGALGGPSTGKEFVFINNSATSSIESLLMPWDNATAACTTS